MVDYKGGVVFEAVPFKRVLDVDTCDDDIILVGADNVVFGIPKQRVNIPVLTNGGITAFIYLTELEYLTTEDIFYKLKITMLNSFEEMIRTAHKSISLSGKTRRSKINKLSLLRNRLIRFNHI